MDLTIAKPEADAGVVGADAFCAALEGLDKRANELWTEHLTCVLDSQLYGVGLNARREPHGALVRQIVDDRVVDEVRRHLQQAACDPMVGALSPEASMLMPRCSANAKSDSVASSAIRDRSTCSGAKER